MLTTLQWLLPLSVVDDHSFSCLQCGGPNGWAQLESSEMLLAVQVASLLLDWVATNCEDFRVMKMVKNATDVGTMIGPEGHIHSPLDGSAEKSSSEPQ